MRRTPWTHTWTLTAGLLAAAALIPATARAADPLERFTAFAVDMSGRARSSATTVDIAIERWTTDDERDRLTAALSENGADSLLKALRKVEPRVGYIRTATSIGYPLRFARQVPLPDGGRRILIATDRRLSFMEVANSRRTVDYPFLVIDMRLAPDGEGEGRLLPLARVELHPDHVVEIENYSAQPVRLTKVKKAD